MLANIQASHILVPSSHNFREPTAGIGSFPLSNTDYSSCSVDQQVRRYVSPRLLIPSSVCLPPLEF